MEKIKELLGKIGASEELANHVCEELERYSTALKEEKEKRQHANILPHSCQPSAITCSPNADLTCVMVDIGE